MLSLAEAELRCKQKPGEHGEVGNSCEVLVIWQTALCLSPAVSSCQFVVSEDQDYAAHFADPDTLVNWDFVEQVVSGFTKFSKSLEGASWLKVAFAQ